MADNLFPFRSEDWLRLQEEYWDAWRELSGLGGAKSAHAEETPPWNQALDRWWKSVSSATPPPVTHFYSHLVDQGKAFFHLAETWRKAASGPGGAADGLQEWRNLLDQSLENIKSSLSSGQMNGEKALGELMAFWELPMDTWERTASLMSGTPGDLFEPLKLLSADRAGGVREQFSKFLSVPGLGYTREHQEQHQTLTRLVFDYQYAKEEYAAQFVKIAAGTVERFQRKTAQLMDKGEPIKTLQELYDQWVDAAEEAYAEQVFSEEYSQVSGRLVNTLMAVKKQGQAMVDETLGMLNMPTQQEVNTLQERLQELRRELRAMRAELQSTRTARAPSTALQATSAGAKTRTASTKATKRKSTRPAAKTPAQKNRSTTSRGGQT